MYTVGARTATVDAFTASPATFQSAGQFAPSATPASYTKTSLTARPAVVRTAPRRTVTRSVQPAGDRVVYREEEPQTRSWQKTAMIIGGSTAGGAGIGGIVGGKKGALIGAAIGGGASSIYEATRRR
jgi:hypothetical protein